MFQLYIESIMIYTKILVDLREEHDWTQTEVANQLCVSQRAYSHYENGDRQIPIDVLIKVAKLYNVSVDYILGLTSNREIIR